MILCWKNKKWRKNINIGIDIDGVLTNDDDYLIDTITKYVYENNLEGLKRPYEYEYRKANWWFIK